MKYAVWFLRLLFAAWMIPAGVNHFIPIFPQPMGSQPLSQELIVALLDSHLFDLVKAVELIAGLGVLLGFYTALALLICLPVSFCVFYWDAPLEGWGSRAALFGYSAFGVNALLCLAYLNSYRSMFTLKAETSDKLKKLVLPGRLILGLWMLFNSINYLFISIWNVPLGTEPLAIQLMTALVNSRLLDVAMVIQLITGVLLLAGVLVPAALALLMPISTCALFWALILDHQPLTVILALAVFSLNGLLMLANFSSYLGVLQRQPLAYDETHNSPAQYDALFASPGGSTAQSSFYLPLLVILAAIAFFAYLVTGRTAHFCMLVLMYPLFVLLARRIRDMGYSTAMLLPAMLIVLAGFGVVLGYFSLGSIDAILPWAGLVVTGAMAGWGCYGNSQSTPGT